MATSDGTNSIIVSATDPACFCISLPLAPLTSYLFCHTWLNPHLPFPPGFQPLLITRLPPLLFTRLPLLLPPSPSHRSRQTAMTRMWSYNEWRDTQFAIERRHGDSDGIEFCYGRGQRGDGGGSAGGLTWAFLSAGELSTADRSAGRRSTSRRRRKKTLPLLGLAS